jgi:type 1 glutamine amidotransferase
MSLHQKTTIKPKAEGEIRVVYLGGDQLHNAMGQRQAIRSVLGKTSWQLLFTQDARYVTPEVLSDTDLLMITRWGGPIEGWCTEPFQEGDISNDGYMTSELEEAIVDNVIHRGMGFMALHCTCWSPDYDKFNEMMGIKGIMHGPVQNVFMHNFNSGHPISAGIDDFIMPLDENFGVELTHPNALPLYETTGAEDKRHDIGGWCLESGKGRVVGLVAGHTHTAWRHETYQKLYWRGAHWALKREIPEA